MAPSRRMTATAVAVSASAVLVVALFAAASAQPVRADELLQQSDKVGLSPVS